MSEEPVNGNGHSGMPEELKALEAKVFAQLRHLETTDVLLRRAAWARQVGATFDGKRDMYGILGYRDLISTIDYRNKYRRGGIAGRVVDVFPNATWRGGMEIIEDETKEEYTEFEQAWADLDKKFQLQAKFLRLDKLSLLSSYAVLLIGAEGEWDQELPKGKKLLYFTPYLGGGGPTSGNRDNVLITGSEATIFEYEQDRSNERFGYPKYYQLQRLGIVDPMPIVHWSRIIHVAEGLLEDEVFGLPALERVWNLIEDLEKTTGGGAEAFWLRANQGFNINLDKDMTLGADELTKLREDLEAYKHGLDRWIRSRGANIETLGSDVANFANPADAILTQIAGAKAIPKRILTGSEMGELASSQDRDNWKDQVTGRQEQHAGPYIVRALVDRLIQYGYLPTPKKGADAYTVKWAHIQTLTETEKSDGAQKWATVNSTMGEPVFTEAEIRDKWYGMAPLSDEQRKEIDDRNAEKLKQQQEAMGAVAPERQTPQEDRFPRAAQEHKLSSTQIDIPEPLRTKILDYGKSIPEFNRAECDEIGEDWREANPHVTVKYGLHTSNVDDVRAALADVQGAVSFTLGALNYFESPQYDVLYVEVRSPQLEELNRKLSNALPNTQTQPSYIPHATIAYLKRGQGKRYAGDLTFDGDQASVASIVFSPALGEDTPINLAYRAAEDAALIEKLAEAIEIGDIDFILETLEFDPTQERDESGKWTKGGSSGGSHNLHSPGDAVHAVLGGKRVSIHEDDVRKFLKKSLNQATPVNLTQVQVEGHHIFGGKGLGIPREEMPQVPKEMRDQFLQEVKEKGISVTKEKVDPWDLGPSQREISAQQVAAKLKKYEDDPKRPFPPIIVSKDDKVLDGHHHWGVMAAVRIDYPDAKIPVYRLSVNARQGLKEMHEFDKRHGIKREAIKAASYVNLSEDFVLSTLGGK